MAQKCSSIYHVLRLEPLRASETGFLGMVMARCHTGADNAEEDSKYLLPVLNPRGHANTANTGWCCS